jgi:hypothetical protein
MATKALDKEAANILPSRRLTGRLPATRTRRQAGSRRDEHEDRDMGPGTSMVTLDLAYGPKEGPELGPNIH